MPLVSAQTARNEPEPRDEPALTYPQSLCITLWAEQHSNAQSAV